MSISTQLVDEQTPLNANQPDLEEIARNEAVYTRVDREAQEIMKKYVMKSMVFSVVSGTSLILALGIDDPISSSLFFLSCLINGVASSYCCGAGALKRKSYKERELKRYGLIRY